MEVDDSLPMNEMHLDEIEDMLADLGANMSPEELREMAEFLKQLGSLDAALEAIEQLERKAA